MTRLKLRLCECSTEGSAALQQDHVGGSGHCQRAEWDEKHVCKCLRFKLLRGGGSKMRNIRTGKADSRGEADRERELRLMVHYGIVRNLLVRRPLDVTPKFECPNCGAGIDAYERITWEIDFQYEELIDDEWRQCFEDFKSEQTYGQAARIQAKLLMGRYCSALAAQPALMRISHYDRRRERIMVETLRSSTSVDFKSRRGGRK